jgi:cytochrome c551/c552
MADAAKPEAQPAKHEPPKELESKAAVQKFLGRAKRTPSDQAEYFYDVKTTHIVFFVSSLLMLASFLAMFRKDDKRPWKDYQKQFAEMDFEKLWYEMGELRKAEDAQRALLKKVDDQVAAYVKALDGKELPAALFDPAAPEKYPRLRDAAKGWDKVHVEVDAKKQKVSLRQQEAIRGEHYHKQQLFNFAKDKLGAVRYQFEEAKHHLDEARKSDPEGRLDKYDRHFKDMKVEWDRVNQEVVDRKKEFDEIDQLKTFYEEFAEKLEKEPVKGVWEGRRTLDELRKERAQLTKDFEDKRARFEKERPSLTNTIRNQPMLDFFDPSLKIKQVILSDLKDQLNFTKIDKVDRCHTCHVGIDNPTYAVWVNRDAEAELDQYTFKDPFLREFVAHALGEKGGKPLDPKDCKVCDVEGRAKPGVEIKAPLTPHKSWGTGDAVRFTKVFMAHPRLDLFVKDGTKHPKDRFGCTVCHEGDGRDTDFTRVVHTPDDRQEARAFRTRHGTPFGEERYNWNYRELWDLPMIPSKFLQASCRRCHTEAVELDGAEKYVQGMKLFERVGCYGCHRTDSYQILPKDTKGLVKSEELNRKFRRPGPPLTRIDTKVTKDWAGKWILAPREFRPATRMPHFFGQSNTRHEANGEPYPPKGAHGKLRSPIEDTIAASIVHYLWTLSETKAEEPMPAGVKGDARRGELLVRQVGCLACHRIEDVPLEAYAKQKKSRYLEEFAPTLAGIGSKIKDKNWLYQWVRNPKKHYPDHEEAGTARVTMPNLRLSEQEAADVVEFLMSLRKPEWEQVAAPQPATRIVNALILEQLRKVMSDFEAQRTLDGKNDAPAYADLKQGDKLRWLGRKMVANYGCYSCHELYNEGKDGKPVQDPRDKDAVLEDWQNREGIGVELTGAQPFGSKHYDKLDFGFAMDDGVNHHGVTFKHGFTGEEVNAHVHETRQDWLAAKLKNPRLFDGGKMSSKPWDELLRMPNFGLTDHEIELLQTFVLSFTDHQVFGLVSAMVKRRSPDEIALDRGERIVRDSNCRACHRMSLDRFEIEWTTVDDKKKAVTKTVTVEGRNYGQAGADDAERALRGWGIVDDATPKEALERMAVYSIAWAADARDLQMPKAINPDNRFVAFDGREWWYLDRDASGKPHKRPIRRHHPMDGGDVLDEIKAFKTKLNKEYVGARDELLDKYDDLEDKVKKEQDAVKKAQLQEQFKAVDQELKEKYPTDNLLDPSNAGMLEARYPPMLRSQGVKTQADWLFGFLKKPVPVRPNIFPAAPGARAMPDVNIRMPTFEFSDEEASSLTRWFAVRDHLPGVDVYPHTPVPEREEAFLAARKEAHEKVMKGVILDPQQGCGKCHYLGGKPPTGDVYAFAPDLAAVERRLRPRWLYEWQAEPAKIYPGTTMTTFDFRQLFGGKQDDGVRAAVEALLNFKRLSTANATGNK